MPLSKLTEPDLREGCRARLEMLELWFRRLIHEKFEELYSNDILNAKNTAGEFVLKKELRERIEKHWRDHPGRYRRPVDAALLNDLITIICKRDTYTSCFATALAVAFPLGNEEARNFLNRLLAPRNHLSHANPISIRQAEQVICYSNDVVYALRSFYAMRGQADAYNAPSILRMWDSFGHVEHAQASHADMPHKFDYSDDPASYLRPGDTLTIEIEVDPSFSEEGFIVKWSSIHSEDQTGRTVIEIRPSCRKPACWTRATDRYKNYFASGLASPSVVGRFLACQLPRFASGVSLGIPSVCFQRGKGVLRCDVWCEYRVATSCACVCPSWVKVRPSGLSVTSPFIPQYQTLHDADCTAASGHKRKW